jgi:glc operon protein GlcG
VSNVDLATAQGLVRKAVESAQAQGVPIAVAVVDRGGHVVASARMDGVSFLMLEVATKKATFAGAMGVPTHMIVEMAKGDEVLALAFSGEPDIVALPGGLPIASDGGPIGGLGVSGGHYTQDQAIAEAAIGA